MYMLRLGIKAKELYRKISSFVEIRLEGSGREQFLNICLRRKIDVWNLKITKERTFLCMSVKAFKKNIRSIARKTGVKVKIIKKGGLPVKLKRYRQRIPLGVYVLLAVAGLMYCSSFIWSVNVRGGTEDDREAVRKYLEDEKIKVGASIQDIDTKDLGNKILLSVDTLKWVTVSKKGTVLNIELLPKDSYQEEEGAIDGPRSIVAKKDALIKKIVAKSGTVVMLENNVVMAGETIISGYVYPIDEIYGTEPRPVRASGEVVGIVRYTANIPVESAVETYVLSGETEVAYSVNIFGKELALTNTLEKLKGKLPKGKECTFNTFNKVRLEDYFALDTAHILPISVIRTEYYETKSAVKNFDGKEAEEYAALMAMKEIDDMIPEEAKVVATGSQLKIIDGVTCYCMWAECEERIGEYVPLHLEK